VSGPNGKLSFHGLSLGSDLYVDRDGTVLAGSYTFGLGPQVGLQFDGVLGQLGGDPTAGVGAHLFWRDPDVALLGLTASSIHLDHDARSWSKHSTASVSKPKST
jgi:hypothetical protein